MQKPIYLDNNATTPLDPRAFQAMQPYFLEHFGNAMSSQHAYGWTAKTALEKAREQCAAAIGAEPREITFTSGATESIHLAILGYVEALLTEAGTTSGTRPHVIVSATEHKCVLDVAAKAEKMGCETTVLPVDRFGAVELATLSQALRPNTALVSVIHGNNEIGTINPIAEIGALCTERGIAFHVDAAQTVGKLPISVREMKIDLLSASGHKIYGPKGVGFLFSRQTAPRVRLAPLMAGGGQEKGLRGGTHNVPGIVGFGAACELANLEMHEESDRLVLLRDRLIRGALDAATAAGVHAELNGHPTQRLPNGANLTFSGVLPDEFTLSTAPYIAFSSASACSSGAGGFSHVLSAIGRTEDSKSVTARFGLGRFTTEEDVTRTLETLTTALKKSAAPSMPKTKGNPH